MGIIAMESKKHHVTYKIKIMKNISIVLAVIFLNLSSFMKGQIIIDYASTSPLPKDWDETGNYYMKDVNNYLNNFVGTWEYVNGNEKFQIILTKVTKYHVLISSPPYSNYNYYEDGIAYKYKKYVNNNVIFESPDLSYPSFNTKNGSKLEGMLRDYERLSKEVTIGGGISIGGGYFPLSCYIEKIMTLIGEPQKIKFKFYLRESSGFGEYDNPIYAGQPFFSIPNDIIMTKVP